MRQLTSSPLLSVVVPCFDEADVLPATHERLSLALGDLPCDYEILYIDDGSRDDTLMILREIQQGDERVRVLSLSRNFGHQVGLTAGMDHASGDAVVLIDADLQDPPELIAEMLEKWTQGFDVAYGTRTRRDGETASKLLAANFFYRLINRLSAVEIPMDTGDFRLMDRRVVEALKDMPERDRFLRGMVSWTGFRQISVPYERAARAAGVTKYPLRKMMAFAVDGIISFSAVPLRITAWLGVLACVIAAFGISYAVVQRLFTNIWVSGWTLLFITILFMAGMQMLSLGLLGEYLARVYLEIKKRPLYLVKDRFGF